MYMHGQRPTCHLGKQQVHGCMRVTSSCACAAVCALVDAALGRNDDIKVHELAFFMQSELSNVADGQVTHICTAAVLLR